MRQVTIFNGKKKMPVIETDTIVTGSSKFLFVTAGSSTGIKYFYVRCPLGEFVSQHEFLNGIKYQLQNSPSMTGYVTGSLRLILAFDTGSSSFPCPRLDGSEEVLVDNFDEMLK